MKVIEKENIVIVDELRDFNLDHIFDCGQCFRWKKEVDGSYTGIAYGKVINVNYIEQKLILENATLDDYNSIWRYYFDLDRDYDSIKRKLAEKDEIMRKAISYGHGMRILQQEKWETLISFIISQNNNIPRIKKCIESICESFGESAGKFKGIEFFTFPRPEVIAKLSEGELAPIRLGYRAKYILETARLVAANEGHTLNRMEEAGINEAYNYLLSLCGVGPKVANCIMLFSMGKYMSFPIDVWVRRVMSQLYLINENDTKAMHAFAAEKFGEYGGIAQQYLFYYIRGNRLEDI